MDAQKNQWSIRDRVLDLNSPRVMGILNLTPDSFSDGGMFFHPEAALRRAREMVSEGADIIDIGAESTRPGSEGISPDLEWSRLAPVLQVLCRELSLPISVDTRHAEVAEKCLEWGVQIINDVSGGAHPELLETVGKASAGYVLIHTRGKSRDMMERAHYQRLIPEINEEMGAALKRGLNKGIPLKKIIFDPGFGFAKTPSQNWEILRQLSQISLFDLPLLVGLSRKRMIREEVGEEPNVLLSGNLAAAGLALAGGARVLRVHDVKETVAMVKVWRQTALR